LIAEASLEAALAPLGGLFRSADAVVANFEAATGEIGRRGPRLAYAAPRGWLGALPRSHVSAITVANNHACDLGDEGLDATLDEADKAKLVAIGADRTDPWTARVLAEQDGRRVCAIAWTTLSNQRGECGRGRRVAMAPLDGEGKLRIDRALAKARVSCDAVIAILHGGEEYVGETTQIRDQSVHAAEAGADAVVIHHPHVPAPVLAHVTRDGRTVPVFASVGNLVTNQGESWKPSMPPVMAGDRRLVCVNGWTRLGVLADLTFGFGEGRRAEVRWGYHLVWTDNSHADDHKVATPRIEVRPLEPTRDAAIVDQLRTDRRGPIALFADPCWLQREGSASDVRCTSNAPPRAPEATEPRRPQARASARGRHAPPPAR